MIRQIPIVFGAESIRAILGGTKTQTRRLADVSPRPGIARFELYPRLPEAGGDWIHPSAKAIDADDPRSRWAVFSHNGDRVSEPVDVWSKLAVGDELWVREAWKNVTPTAGCDHKAIPPGPEHKWDTDGYGYAGVRYRATWTKVHTTGWSSPRFMPRWASRLTLVCVGRRLERLQEIREADAIAEGVTDEGNYYGVKRERYVEIFRSINEHRLKGRPVVEQLNPYVWRIEFRLKGST